MIRSLIIGGLLLLFAKSQAQQMWPGDINNNGIVNHVDLLYLGNAIGTVGPARLDMGIEWEAKDVPVLWPQDFPNGVNYAYADCDGNGVIDQEDFNAIEFNYDFTHGTLLPDDFDTGISGASPSLFFGEPFDPIFEGGVGLVPIVFGTEDLPVDDFHGVAYTIRYDPSIIQIGFFPFPEPDLFEEDWLDIDNGDEPLAVFNPNMTEGKLEVAITRTNGGLTMTNFGNFGAVFIIIVDNVVGLGADEVMTEMYIEDIKLFDELGTSTAVLGDSIPLTIYNDDIINSTSEKLEESIQVYPNPVNDLLVIQSKNALIEQIELFDVTGHRVEFLPGLSDYNLRISSENYPSGIYNLRIQTTNGQLSKKVVIQH